MFVYLVDLLVDIFCFVASLIGFGFIVFSVYSTKQQQKAEVYMRFVYLQELLKLHHDELSCPWWNSATWMQEASVWKLIKIMMPGRRFLLTAPNIFFVVPSLMA